VKALTGGRLNSSQPTWRSMVKRRHDWFCVIEGPSRAIDPAQSIVAVCRDPADGYGACFNDGMKSP
jgi:hypothetical protein